MQYAWEMCTIFQLENLKGRDHLEDIGIDGKYNIRMDLSELGLEGLDWMHLTWERDNELLKDSAPWSE
jgi:hypothetical protein